MIELSDLALCQQTLNKNVEEAYYINFIEKKTQVMRTFTI